MSNDPRCWNDLATRIVELEGRLAKAQGTIEALAAALGRENPEAERAAFAALEAWVAERKRPLGEGDR